MSNDIELNGRESSGIFLSDLESCQTWNLNQQQQRMRSFYTVMVRKMIRHGFERRNRYNDVEDSSYAFSNKTKDVISRVEKQQFKYLAHIVRLKNSNNAKRLLFNDDRNHRRGRPLKAMKQHVLQNNNISADEFYRRALRADTDMVGNRSNHSMSAPVDRS